MIVVAFIVAMVAAWVAAVVMLLVRMLTIRGVGVCGGFLVVVLAPANARR